MIGACSLNTTATVHFEPDGAPAGRDRRSAARALALSARLGLPTRLRDAGVPKSDLVIRAAEAMKQTRLLVNNPRALSEADALASYQAAW